MIYRNTLMHNIVFSLVPLHCFYIFNTHFNTMLLKGCILKKFLYLHNYFYVHFFFMAILLTYRPYSVYSILIIGKINIVCVSHNEKGFNSPHKSLLRLQTFRCKDCTSTRNTFCASLSL